MKYCEEADAVELAREQLQFGIDCGDFGDDQSAHHKTALEYVFRFPRNFQFPRDEDKLNCSDHWPLPVMVYDDAKAVPVIEMAVAGDRVADALLRKFAAEQLSEGLEPNLAAYIRNELLADRNQSNKTGWSRTNGRDYWIYFTVQIIQPLGFRVTRNNSTERASACSIVATALAEVGVPMPEKTVEGVWLKVKRIRDRLYGRPE